MTDELPPPPAYHSLFDSSATPGSRTSTGGFEKSFGLQPTSYPPSHPFYPGNRGVPQVASAPGYGCPGSYTTVPTYPTYPPYPSAPAMEPGLAPPVGATGPPEYNYVPAAAQSYGPTGSGLNPPPPGPIYPYGAITQQPTELTDPLKNPASPFAVNVDPAFSNTAGEVYPTSAQAPITRLTEIPVVINNQSDNPVNPNEPPLCTLSDLSGFPNMHIAEGQAQDIEQLNHVTKHNISEWCCVAFWSIGSHVSFFACVFLLVWQVPLKREYDAWHSAADRAERTGPKANSFAYDHVTLICASVFLCVCYLIAVIEGCASDTDDYVQNVKSVSEYQSIHNVLRMKVPVVVWKAEAFHDGKERIKWENGAIVSRRNSEDTHKCVIFKEEVAFPFSRCVDASGDLKDFKPGQINRFQFEKTFGFLDEHTATVYEEQKLALIKRVKDMDKEHSFEEVLVLPGFTERGTVFSEDGCCVCLMSGSLYNYLTCILCTWPYRIFFRCRTSKRKFTYVKLIGM